MTFEEHVKRNLEYKGPKCDATFNTPNGLVSCHTCRYRVGNRAIGYTCDVIGKKFNLIALDGGFLFPVSPLGICSHHPSLNKRDEPKRM